MAIPNRTEPSKIGKSTQEMQNLGFDDEFNVPTVQILGYDSALGVLRRITTDALSHFGTNDVDKNANGSVYEGLEDAGGSWQVVKITTSGVITSNRFATIKNNSGHSTYADAWADRLTLTYGTYGEAF